MPPKDVRAALNGEDMIPKERVLGWMRESALDTRGAVYQLTRTEWARIQPELTMSEQCEFMLDYLVECLVKDPASSKWAHTGFEAGWELASWLKHLKRLPDTNDFLARVAAQFTAAYRKGDSDTRNRIETSALEHIFEEPSLRPFFEEWRDDPQLREAYQFASEWGDAHPA